MNQLSTHLVHRILSSRLRRTPEDTFANECEHVLDLIDTVTEIMSHEDATLELDGEFTIVGDVHGNIDSLLRIFEHSGYPPSTSYIFLGDYVDRGHNSCECIVLLYALKCLFPTKIYLLRGNHECESLTTHYGFGYECNRRLNMDVYNAFVASFDELPIIVIINSTTMCVHGGISEQIKSRDDLLSIQKPIGDIFNGVVSDLLWSDPSIDCLNYDISPRGAGHLYGPDATNEFLKNCGFTRLIRAHEQCNDGFSWPFGEDGGILTIFSSCDYCNGLNDAASCSLNNDNEISLFTLSPLIGRKRQMRRVILPEWTLTFAVNSMKSVQTEDPILEIDLPQLILA